MAEGKQVLIQVYGKEYSIVSSEEPEVTAELARHIDSVMREISAKTGADEPNRVAILALLKITHDLFTLKKQTDENAGEFESKMDNLTREISAMMADEGVQTDILGD